MNLFKNKNDDAVEAYLNEHYELRRNIILGKLEIRAKGSRHLFRDLDDIQFNTLLRRAYQLGHDFKPMEMKMTLHSEFVTEYDPFIEYVNNLPAWEDGQDDYISMLANTLTTREDEKEFWEICLRKWLVAAIGCAIDPDTINQTVLLLTGKQGIGKTSWLTNLLPKQLSRYYYSGAINPTNKDSIIHCGECFLVNMDELGGFIEKKQDDFKELITKSYIRIRRPYSAKIENMPRRCSFMGSTNHFQFLHDSTGSRRILGFEAITINIPRFEISAVWSQALHLYKNGFQYWFSNEEEEQLHNHNHKFQIMSFEEELVLSNFENCKPEQDPELSLTSTQILQLIIRRQPSARRCNVRNIGLALQKNGFRPRKSNGNQLYDLRIKD